VGVCCIVLAFLGAVIGSAVAAPDVEKAPDLQRDQENKKKKIP
jgi:hypothetical protein